MVPGPQLSESELEAAVRLFDISGRFQSAEELRRGHIHTTYVSTWTGPDGPDRYLHQRLNAEVFRDIPALMHNVGLVTRHLAAGAGAGSMEALQLVPAAGTGADYAVTPDAPWRTYRFIEGTVSYDHPKDAGMAHTAAAAFGDFQVRLAGLDAKELRTTIPDFFDSEVRLRQLDEAAVADVAGHRASVAAELAFVGERRACCTVMEDALRSGRMPARVVHGDTKLNNVLFDRESGEPRCVVDLDTCMPGYSLYDFGDLVRFTAATCDEDEQDLDRARIDEDTFEALQAGYLEHAAGFLTAFEREHMAFSARLVTLTIGMRFLADHLAGDRYFKISRPGQNLDRARVQFALVADMERRLGGRA